MAKIHNAHNELQEKISKIKVNRISHWSAIRRMEIRNSAIMLITGIIIFVIVFKFPNIANWLKNLATEIMSGIKHPLLALAFPNNVIFGNFLNGSFIPDLLGLILDGSINLVIFLLILLIDLLTFVLSFIAPYALWACCYLLPAGLAIFGTKGLFTALTSNVYWELATTSGEQEEILQAGLEGEQKALKQMELLPDQCHIYTNLMIPYDGKVSETDMIVVSDSGITIIEVKNHKGTITGSAHDEKLSHHKLHGRNETETKTFYNPIKQVATHAYRLKEFLHANGVHTHVRTCVFFINEEAILQLNDLNSNCPVFDIRNAYALRTYLTGNDAALPEHAKRKAISLLNDLVDKSFQTTH